MGGFIEVKEENSICDCYFHLHHSGQNELEELCTIPTGGDWPYANYDNAPTTLKSKVIKHRVNQDNLKIKSYYSSTHISGVLTHYKHPFYKRLPSSNLFGGRAYYSWQAGMGFSTAFQSYKAPSKLTVDSNIIKYTDTIDNEY